MHAGISAFVVTVNGEFVVAGFGIFFT